MAKTSAKAPSWPPKGIPQQFAVGFLIGIVGTGVLALGYLALARTGTRPQAVVAPPSPVAQQVAPVPAPPAAPAPVVAAPPSPPNTPAPPAPSAPPRLIAAEVELVDCVGSGAPAWCRQVRAATKSERAGTLVAIVRSKVPGDVFACTGGRYIGIVPPDGYASTSLVKKLRAHTIDRLPRGSASQYDYLIRPEGSGLPEPKWMSACL